MTRMTREELFGDLLTDAEMEQFNPESEEDRILFRRIAAWGALKATQQQHLQESLARLDKLFPSIEEAADASMLLFDSVTTGRLGELRSLTEQEVSQLKHAPEISLIGPSVEYLPGKTSGSFSLASVTFYETCRGYVTEQR